MSGIFIFRIPFHTQEINIILQKVIISIDKQA